MFMIRKVITMKKVLLSLLAVCFVFISFPYSVRASEARTVLYLNYGDVVLSETSVTGFDENGNPVSEVNPCGYTITQTDPNTPLDKSITVSSGTQDVEIKNINISRTVENGYAFCVLKDANASITLSGENHLSSGLYRAGLDIAVTASVTIGGDGILYAQSDVEAGIGGGNGKSNGTLTINSGTIYATGGIDGYAAGIGGGSSGKGGTITINGGSIVAVGGDYAAGIGGGNLCTGGTITINGGVVTAIGGLNGAGIGGGFFGSGGTVTINGGSVKAVGGTDADDIGNGYNCSKAFDGIHNSEGKEVSLVTVEVPNLYEVYFNGINNSPITAGHPDDSNLYLYCDENPNVATAYMSDGDVKFFSYSNSGHTELLPFLNGDVRAYDYLITTDRSNTSVAESFSISETGNDFEYNLMYGDVCIDRFTSASRGDINLDGKLDGMDAVKAACVTGGMLTDRFSSSIADADGNGQTENADIDILAAAGIA